MKHVLLCIAALLITLPGMARQKKHRKVQPAATTIRSITMERSGCYGRCPAYTISIDKSGTAHYRGILFTADSGSFVKKAGAKKAEQIFSKTIANRVDTCQDTYKAMAVDLPGLILTIEYAGKTKTIQNANYGPSVLRQLYQSLDSLTGGKLDKTWQREKHPAGSR